MQNPSNPYNSSSSSPGLPSRGPEISFDAIGQAWKLLQPNLGTWIGAALIYGVVILLLQGVQGAFTPKSSTGVPQFGLMSLVFSLLGFVVGQFFVGGLFRMALGNVRTGRANLGDMFSAGDVIPNLLIAGILTTIAIGIGCLLCLVPGLLLSGLFLFVTPLIVDKRLGAMEAISTSLDALKPQMWTALLFAIVIGLVAGAGALACGVGMLVTAPLALLALAVTYNNFVSGGQSLPTTMPPSAPIADPFK